MYTPQWCEDSRQNLHSGNNYRPRRGRGQYSFLKGKCRILLSRQQNSNLFCMLKLIRIKLDGVEMSAIKFKIPNIDNRRKRKFTTKHRKTFPTHKEKDGQLFLIKVVTQLVSNCECMPYKGTSRQRSGKGAIRKSFPLQKTRWEKTKLTIRYLYHETYRKPNEQLFSQKVATQLT